MKTITFKPEFEEKLKKLHVKRMFVRNLNAYCEAKKQGIETRVTKLNKCETFERFCLMAFTWGKTSEGVNFWENISES
jgi:hypothetical protein